MQNQVSGSTKAGPATVISRGSTPPQTVKKDPTAGESRNKEAPTLANVRGLFVGQEIIIFAPPGHFITRVYDRADGKEEFGQFQCKLLDASFAENGAPQWALVEYKEKGSRKFYSTDVIPMEGCSISLIRERDEDSADEGSDKN